jgi:hypothetical protein
MNPELNHFGALAPPDPTGIASMTREQAGEFLAARKAAYDLSQRPTVTATTPPAVAAHHKLAELERNPAFRAKLLSGDAAATAEYRRLNEAVSDPAAQADFALAGLKPTNHVDATPGAMGMREQIEAVKDLRSMGWSDAAIREAISGEDAATRKAFSPEIIARAKTMRADRMSDPEWQRQLFAGNQAVARESQYLSVIIGSEVVEL